MNEPLTIPSQSPRFGLPLLFSGQAQKEFYVNEAHSLIDMLLHPAIEGEAAAPPASPAPGACWLVATDATREWAGHAGEIASFQAGTWLFAMPQDGMRVFDRSSLQALVYRGGWVRPVAPDPVAGGDTVDVQARTAIEQLVAALIAGGIIAPPSA